MPIALEMGPHFAVLSTSHDLTVFFADQTIEALLTIQGREVSLVAFDLSKAEWADAYGIGALLLAARINGAQRRPLPVIGARENVRRHLTASAAGPYLAFVDDREEARSHLVRPLS